MHASEQSASLPKAGRTRWPLSLGIGLVMLAVVLALFGPLLAPYEKNFASAAASAKPTWQHWLGTDPLGKDVLARICYGARLSLLCGVLSILLAITLGAPLGALAGYYGGVVDAIAMRSVDIALTFPGVLIALVISVALPPGWTRVVVAVGLMNIPGIARQCRATVLTVRNLDYVTASRALGATPLRTLRREILPALAGPLLTLGTLGLGSAILEVAALSFLGIGGDPTEPEWGSMLSQARSYWSQNPWAALGPGLAISLTVLGFQLVGEALSEWFEPATRQSQW